MRSHELGDSRHTGDIKLCEIFSEVKSEVAQLCPTLSDPMDCSLPDFSVHGIFQARILEWGAMSEVLPKTCCVYRDLKEVRG